MTEAEAEPSPGDGRSGSPHRPVRTCVGCGEAEGRVELIRLVRSPDGEIVVDLRGRLPGRGAWVHPDRACAAKIQKDPRRLARALKAPAGPREVEGLEQRLVEAVLRAVLDGLSLASAGGVLIGGHDTVELGLRSGRVVEVLFAADAAERTMADVGRAAGDCPITRLPLDKEALGARVGQAPRAVVALVGASGFRHLREQLRRLRSLG